MAKNSDWTEKEKLLLIKNYQDRSKEEILKIFPERSWQGIQIQASKLGVYRLNYFTKEETDIIKENYYNVSSGKIAKIINRSIANVEKKARELGLIKKEKWSEKEIYLLRKNFGFFTVLEIKKKIIKNRTLGSINHMIQLLSLQKNKKRYSDVSDEEIIDKFKSVCLKEGRTINAKELSKFDLPSSTVISKRFGSYGKFCEKSQVAVNTGYVKTYKNISILKEVCLSNSEKIICDFLYNNKIEYIKEVPYSKIIESYNGKLRSDWLLKNGVVIEFFGMERNKRYKEKIIKKIDLCNKNGIILIEIYEKDLNKLNEKIFPFIK